MKLSEERKGQIKLGLRTKRVRKGRRESCILGPPAGLRRGVQTAYCLPACSCLSICTQACVGRWPCLPSSPLLSTTCAH